MCVFAAFGGVFFGFDSGYISGVLAMPYFISLVTGIPIPGPDASAATVAAFVIPTPHKSLIVSILSAGTFFGAIMAGDLADWFGRRTTVILGCIVYGIGCILQTASSSLGLLVAGRLIAGFGVGFVSAIIILYMSEIAPKKVRGAIVSGKLPPLPSDHVSASPLFLLPSSAASLGVWELAPIKERRREAGDAPLALRGPLPWRPFFHEYPTNIPQATNSPSQSVSSSRPASTTRPRTASTAAPTASPWASNSSGPSSSAQDSSSSPNPPATSS
jgi:hypothetical protein